MSPALAVEEAEQKKALPIPRFVTLGTDEVNLRTGPGLRYPIVWVVKKEGLPVEVIREYDVWRQVRDHDGAEGWVHQSMLSGKRAVVVTGQVRPVFKSADAASNVIVKLEPGVVAELETCRNELCKISVAQFEGWLERQNLWGVYPKEQFEQ